MRQCIVRVKNTRLDGLILVKSKKISEVFWRNYKKLEDFLCFETKFVGRGDFGVCSQDRGAEIWVC